MSTPTSYAETEAASTASALADKAKDMGARAKAAVSDQADAMVDRLRPKIDAVNDYVRTEPTKALLIAAATGAGLMALVALAAKSSSNNRMPSVDSSDLAAALRDLAKRAPKAANEAADEGKKRASAAADMISDTWQQLREQAGPAIDRIRPQLDAVTAFAKEDPVKAAAGVALAGALLAGIVALIRGRMDD
jgi:ElaB/YqjD/DUF883 family membrane-anchored ribosome-binding protein